MQPGTTRRWTPLAMGIGLLLMLLGAWVFFVPLVGPYFDFGFFTSRTWEFSGRHWEMLLGTGIALFVSGLLVTVPIRAAQSLGALLSLAASAWLLAGPSLHPIWSGQIAPVHHHAQWLTSLVWIGYFYGTGAVGVYLSALLHALLMRRRPADEMPVIEETPVRSEPDRTRERELVQH